MKHAESKTCSCNKEDENIVYIDSIDGVDTEFETLYGFYCIKCNSFWREP